MLALSLTPKTHTRFDLKHPHMPRKRSPFVLLATTAKYYTKKILVTAFFFYYVSSNFGWLADFFFSCVGLSRVCIAFEKGATKACNEIEARKCSLEQKKSKRQKSFFLIFFSLSRL